MLNGCSRRHCSKSHRSDGSARVNLKQKPLANVSHLSRVTGGRHEAHLQAHRVDNSGLCHRGIRSLGTTQDVCPRRSAAGEGRGSDRGTRTRLCLAARLLPVETWRLLLETGRLGAPSGEACDVGFSSLGQQPPRVVQDARALENAAAAKVVRGKGCRRTGSTSTWYLVRPWCLVRPWYSVLGPCRAAIQHTPGTVWKRTRDQALWTDQGLWTDQAPSTKY